jgi:peptidoglycan/xylan/chitin deacetylase (PgdA/CDA1 family)
MNLRSQLGDIRRSILCAAHRRTLPLGNGGPIVSFTFDDFPRSALHTAGQVLEQYGARGTYYVAGGLMNVTNELGELFHAEDLDSALERGHELGTQTFHHSSCRSVSLNEFWDDVQQGNQLIKNVVGHNSTNFAYPYGHATFHSKRILGPRLTSSRSIIPGFNGPEVDLNLLRANCLYGDLDQAPRIAALVQENVKQKTWLIFYTHDVRPDASEYGCTPGLFQSAVSLAARSGSRILTIANALSEFGVAIPGETQATRKHQANLGCFPVKTAI